METTFDVRELIESSKNHHLFTKIDKDHYVLEKPYGQAQINFYNIGENQEEVVEFKIISQEDPYQPKFFLHFQQNNKEHSEELFSEFLQYIDELDNHQVKEILLCCTSAFTTSYFAQKLNEEAKQRDLPYSFSAVSVSEIYGAGEGKYAILLAPQIAYMQKEIAQIMKNTHVFTIPGKLFGAFDARTYLSELDLQLKDIHNKKEEIPNHKINDYTSEEKILVIDVVTNAKQAKIYYRIYDHLKIVVDNCVRKRKLNLEDINDIIKTQALGRDGKINVDKIGIAIPGMVHDGKLDLPKTRYLDLNNGQQNGFEIKKWFEETYGIPVFIFNNTNAAAVGWHAMHAKEYKNIIFYSQPKGWIVGGQGIICDGKIVYGRKGLAGENRFIFNQFNFQNPLTFNANNPESILQMVTKIILMDIATIDPEVICLRCDLLTDMQVVKNEVSKYIDSDYIPEIVKVTDYNEHIMTGALIYCLHS